MLKRAFVLTVAALLTLSCGRKQPLNFEPVRSDFVFGSLALSPVSATQQGLPPHKGLALDEMLDDYSPAGMRGQHMF